MTDTNSNECKKTMLVVLAHPDDESFGMGGTLAHYARQGVDVHLICATGGENGTVDPEFLENGTSIAELRAGELACAAEKLGLASVIMGGYRDSGMSGSDANNHPDALMNQPLEAVALKIAHHIRDLRPQVVITHNPIGGYKHPDHIAVHKATVRAFYIAGNPKVDLGETLPPYQPEKLYYRIIPLGWLKFMLKISPFLGANPRNFGRNKDVDLLDLVEERDFPTHLKINIRKVLKIRDAASACHASQLASGPPNRGVFSLAMRLLAGYDHYTRAYPEPEPDLKETDFFEGIL